MSMKFSPSISGPLQIGSRGPGVAAVQTGLNSALQPSPQLQADGVFGPKTAQAVRSFQQRRGLGADGVVGPQTAAALGLGYTSGGGGGMPAPPPGSPPAPGMPPPSGPPVPGGQPPGFVDLAAVSVIVEAIIAGSQRVGSRLLSWIDSDYVPQMVYDRVESILNGGMNTLASQLRGIARSAVPAGQDPALFITGRIRETLSRHTFALSNALQPLVGLPIIGGVASGYQRLVGSQMAAADAALDGLRSGGQSAQAAATRIMGIFDSVARQIG